MFMKSIFKSFNSRAPKGKITGNGEKKILNIFCCDKSLLIRHCYVCVGHAQAHTQQKERQETEVHNLFEMCNQRIIWIVDGICLNTERRTGHNIQTVRSYEPEGGQSQIALKI